jgi:protein-S-isoprenylcysteine O-methyltransferase Ste14
MIDIEEMKKKYPRVMIVLRGLWIVVSATILSIILVSPLYIFDIDRQILVNIFTFPVDIIPQPYNLVGVLPIPIGMFLVAWANYALLHIGKIGLRNREPMRTPSKLVLVGPYRYSRNPIYLGVLMILVGSVIVWSSMVALAVLIVVYSVFRYIFIKKEEIILEEAFGEEYRDFKSRVKRWL